MWCSQLWTKMNPQMIGNIWRMSKIYMQIELPCLPWMMDRRKKSRIKETTYELANLISF